jgi:predicted nucleic acid-binding protein
MTCVIDASVALGWSFKDEFTSALQKLLQRVKADGAVVPSLWATEVANGLLQGEKRGRIAWSDCTTVLTTLAALPIETDGETVARAWSATLSLARAERLTVYDAAYLELAARRALPLASLDEDLTAAAKKIGVAVLI